MVTFAEACFGYYYTINIIVCNLSKHILRCRILQFRSRLFCGVADHPQHAHAAVATRSVWTLGPCHVTTRPPIGRPEEGLLPLTSKNCATSEELPEEIPGSRSHASLNFCFLFTAARQCCHRRQTCAWLLLLPSSPAPCHFAQSARYSPWASPTLIVRLVVEKENPRLGVSR